MRKNVKEALERGMEKGVQLETLREELKEGVIKVSDEEYQISQDSLITLLNVLGIDDEDLASEFGLKGKFMDCQEFIDDFLDVLDCENKDAFSIPEIEKAVLESITNIAMSPDEAIACGYIEL